MQDQGFVRLRDGNVVPRSELRSRVNKVLKTPSYAYCDMNFIISKTKGPNDAVIEMVGDYIVSYVKENYGISFSEVCADLKISDKILMDLIENQKRIDMEFPTAEEMALLKKKQKDSLEKTRNLLQGLQSNSNQSINTQRNNPRSNANSSTIGFHIERNRK